MTSGVKWKILYSVGVYFVLKETFSLTNGQCTSDRQPLILNATKTPLHFSSPNYPSAYPDNAHCSWLITAPRTRDKIIFEVNAISLERCCDSLSVHDGGSDGDPLAIKMRGGEISYNYTSSGNLLYFVFRSDSGVQFGGFNIIYRLLSTVADCGPVVAPDNGYIHMNTGNQTTHNSTMTYRCHIGYQLVGNDERTCLDSEHWSGEDPLCIRDCGPPDDPTRGKVHFKTTLLDSPATFECEVGFRVNGSGVSRCQENGIWSEPNRVCEVVACGLSKIDIIFILDASTSVTEQNFQKVRNFVKEFLSHTDINSGSVRVGMMIYSTDVKIQFHLNEFSTEADILAAVDNIPYIYGSTNTADAMTAMRDEMFITAHGDRPDARNIAIILTDGISNINSRRTLPEAKDARDAGIHIYAIGIGLMDTRELDGIASEPASANSFNTQTFDELKELDKIIFSSMCPDCGPPDEPTHGNVHFNTTSLDSLAIFECELGFRINGSDVSRCQKDGIWSGQNTVCEVIDCGPPDEPIHGYVEFNTTRVDSLATFECEEGYWVNGRDGARCQGNGIWSGPIPVCEVVDCGTPVGPTNGSVVALDTMFDAMAIFKCNVGFKLIGRSNSKCKADGAWEGASEGTVPSCIIVDCGTPAGPVNGSVVARDTTFNSVAIFVCNVGYKLSGNSNSKCKADGTWDGTVPSCKLVDCGDLANPNHGNVSLLQEGQTTYTSAATYTCDVRYTLVGYSVRTCLSSGIWSGNEPFCAKEKVKDVSPDCPDSRYNEGNDWEATHPGHIITKPCSKGFEGEISRECSLTGVWLLPENSCIRRQLAIIQQQIQTITEEPSSPAVTVVLDQLSNITTVEGKNTSIMAGEIKAVTSLLGSIADVSQGMEVTNDQTQKFLSTASNLLDMSNQDSWNTLSQTSTTNKGTQGADQVLQVINNFAEAIVKTLNASHTEQQTIAQNNMVVTVSSINPDNMTDIRFPGDSSTLPDWLKSSASGLTLSQDALKGATSYSAVFYKNLTGIMPPRSKDQQNNTSMLEINSAVLSLKLSSHTKTLDPPLEITFTHFKTQSKNPKCSFWNYISDRWDTEGCKLIFTNTTVTICQCDHLTNFAILMSPWHQDHVVSVAMDIVTMLGCSISLVCLFITVTLHIVLWRTLKSDRVVILINLSTALVISYAIFLAGVDKTENKVTCTAIAVLLHYIYLVVFCMMLAEGIETFILVVFPFLKRSRLIWLIPSAWAFPLFIVGISMGATQLEGYGTDKFCWLSVNNGLIWGFVGPAFLILLINSVLIAVIMKRMFATRTHSQKSLKEKVLTSVRCLCVLMPLMGCTWIIGIFNFNNRTLWVQYAFAVCNSLQGLVIFILHCIFNQQMQRAIQMRHKKYKDSSSASKSVSSHSNKKSHVETEQTDQQSTV